MTGISEVQKSQLISKLAVKLKDVKEVKAPVWAGYVKTGVFKERPPIQTDWWHIRTASILVSIYNMGPVGVEKLRTKYGGKKNRGVKPEIFKKGSGSIVRKALQQLDSAGFTKKSENASHKGRVVTTKGKKFVDNVAVELKAKPAKQ